MITKQPTTRANRDWFANAQGPPSNQPRLARNVSGKCKRPPASSIIYNNTNQLEKQ